MKLMNCDRHRSISCVVVALRTVHASEWMVFCECCVCDVVWAHLLACCDRSIMHAPTDFDSSQTQTKTLNIIEFMHLVVVEEPMHSSRSVVGDIDLATTKLSLKSVFESNSNGGAPTHKRTPSAAFPFYWYIVLEWLRAIWTFGWWQRQSAFCDCWKLNERQMGSEWGRMR